jgi:amino acid transporter
MPEASGSVAWVEAAFGPWWAFQKGYMSWLSGVADNALYPILFLDCALELVTDERGATPLDWDESGGMRWVLIILLTAALTYLNYRGLDVVTEVAIGICLFSLLPFVAFCILSAPQVDPARWLQTPPGGLAGVDWRLLLNTFFWCVGPRHSPSLFPSSFLSFFLPFFLT